MVLKLRCLLLLFATRSICLAPAIATPRMVLKSVTGASDQRILLKDLLVPLSHRFVLLEPFGRSRDESHGVGIARRDEQPLKPTGTTPLPTTMPVI